MRFLIVFFSLLIAAPVFAVTQTYYLRSSGSGLNAGDTGAWDAVPTTDGNAMSASNFNHSGNWSATDNASLIDADDTVYVNGGGFTSSEYNLTPVYGVTLDFYEAGDYNPVTMLHTIQPQFTWCQIYITVDGVTIQDGRFNGPYYGAAASIHAAPTGGTKISDLVVQRNVFYAASDYPSVYLGFVCDSKIVNNYFQGYVGSSWDDCNSSWARGIMIHAGSRNKFSYNHVNGGFTGLIFMANRDFNQDGTVDIPSATGYALDPDGSYRYNEISYNYIEQRCEEGISYDVEAAARSIPMVERDTVASVSGTSITLNHGGWAAAGDLYSGYYMVAITERDATYGGYGLIETHSNASFTLDQAITGLQVGDEVIIGLVFLRNWIHHNSFGSRGFGYGTLWLEGTALDNLVEYNETPPRNYAPEGFAVHVSSIYGNQRAEGSITGTTASEVAAYNIVRNNTVGGMRNINYGKEFGGSVFTVRNNAFIDNTLHQTYYPRVLNLSHARAYTSNTGSVILENGSSLLSADPTTSVASWFSGWVEGEAPPGYSGPPVVDDTDPPLIQEVVASGTEITISFNESVDASGYTTGEFEFDCATAGNNLDLTRTSATDGAIQLFSVATAVAAGEVCTLDYIGTSIEDLAENDLATFTGLSVDTGVVPGPPSVGTVGSGATVVIGVGANIIVN